MGFWCVWVEWGSGLWGRMGFWCVWVEWGSGVSGQEIVALMGRMRSGREEILV